jgi:hypothetical protein
MPELPSTPLTAQAAVLCLLGLRQRMPLMQPRHSGKIT